MKFNKIDKGHSGLLFAWTGRALVVKLGKRQFEVIL